MHAGHPYLSSQHYVLMSVKVVLCSCWLCTGLHVGIRRRCSFPDDAPGCHRIRRHAPFVRLTSGSGAHRKSLTSGSGAHRKSLTSGSGAHRKSLNSGLAKLTSGGASFLWVVIGNPIRPGRGMHLFFLNNLVRMFAWADLRDQSLH